MPGVCIAILERYRQMATMTKNSLSRAGTDTTVR
jgi:hypothetical protein